VRTLKCEPHEVVGIRVELLAVTPLQQLRVVDHHAQRLLQVVRGDVGKLLQIPIRADQLLGSLGELLLRRLILGDVAKYRKHARDILDLQNLARKLRREHFSVSLAELDVDAVHSAVRFQRLNEQEAIIRTHPQPDVDGGSTFDLISLVTGDSEEALIDLDELSRFHH